jgi:hypothetical protein
MPVSLNDLPQFELLDFLPITEYGQAAFSGQFNRIEGVREMVCWLRVSGEKYSRGALHAVDAASGAALFLPWEGREYLAVGIKVPWIDGFWKRTDIEMVVDPAWLWKESRFEATDAWRMTADAGGAMLCPAPGKGMPPAGVSLMPKGWDHEHCHFCGQTIGAGGLATGFVDHAGTWLCEGCHSRFVVTHDLSFMEIFGKIWPAANSQP